MNKSGLKKSVGYRVQLRPAILDSNGQPLDSDWIIREVGDDYVSVEMVGYGYVTKLGLDHVYSFLTNPQRDDATTKYGFLQLHLQLTARGADVHIEPLPPPKAVAVDATAHARRFSPLVLETSDGNRYFSWRGRDPIHYFAKTVRRGISALLKVHLLNSFGLRRTWRPG